MAKDKAAKERARAKKKKDKRVREQHRQHVESRADRATAQLWSGVSTPSALADLVNVRAPHAVMSQAQKKLEALLESSGLKRDVSQFVQVATTEYDDEPLGPLDGSAFYLLEIDEEPGWCFEDEILPPSVNPLGTEALEAFAQRVRLYEDREAGVWLLWVPLVTPVAVAFAADRHGTRAAWAVSGEGPWYRLNKCTDAMDVLQTFARHVQDERWNDDLAWIAQLGLLVDTSVVARMAEDPEVCKAVYELKAKAQMGMHHSLVVAARLFARERAIGDILRSEAEEEAFARGAQSARKQVDQVGRKLAEVERQKDALERKLAARPAPAANNAVAISMPLAQRLASIFGPGPAAQ